MPSHTASLEQRGQVLEDEFFRDETTERHRLRARKKTEDRKILLREVSGLRSEPVLHQLVGRGVSAASMHALALVPVVEVAWADEKIQAPERDAILRGAAAVGIREGSPAHALLQSSLQRRPSPALFVAWAGYIKALGHALSLAEFRALEEETLERARTVAAAAGGFLGLKKISAAEQAILDRMTAIFEAARPGPPR